MATKLTSEQCRARAISYEEAAGHLELAWTDDTLEREEGDRLARMFHAECARYRAMATVREFATRDSRLSKPRKTPSTPIRGKANA